MKLEESIKKKKWTSQEIEKTLKILDSAKRKKPALVQFLDVTIYWAALFLAILGNFIVSVVLVPLLIVLTGPFLYFTLFFVGASFGTLIYTVVRMIEATEAKQNFISGLFITALAVINIYMITNLTNRLELMMGITTNIHEPIVISAVYALGYILPYSVYVIKDVMKKRQTLNTQYQ